MIDLCMTMILKKEKSYLLNAIDLLFSLINHRGYKVFNTESRRCI